MQSYPISGHSRASCEFGQMFYGGITQFAGLGNKVIWQSYSWHFTDTYRYIHSLVILRPFSFICCFFFFSDRIRLVLTQLMLKGSLAISFDSSAVLDMSAEVISITGIFDRSVNVQERQKTKSLQRDIFE